MQLVAGAISSALLISPTPSQNNLLSPLRLAFHRFRYLSFSIFFLLISLSPLSTSFTLPLFSLNLSLCTALFALGSPWRNPAGMTRQPRLWRTGATDAFDLFHPLHVRARAERDRRGRTRLAQVYIGVLFIRGRVYIVLMVLYTAADATAAPHVRRELS